MSEKYDELLEQNKKLMESLRDSITTMQTIKLICQKAKAHYIEESDIDEILDVLKGKV